MSWVLNMTRFSVSKCHLGKKGDEFVAEKHKIWVRKTPDLGPKSANSNMGPKNDGFCAQKHKIWVRKTPDLGPHFALRAPSSFRVRMREPAPKELKVRKAPSKLKLKKP
jgi:hypothetical protein